jgi:hypothetical protein
MSTSCGMCAASEIQDNAILTPVLVSLRNL